MARRLPTNPNEWIDRKQPIEFSFEGTKFSGYAGDTISSALLASNQKLLGRSFKYHRPRGVLSAANHDANVLLETSDKVNIRGDVEAPLNGHEYYAVNTIGGLKYDAGRFLKFLSALLPVGFYYKAFYRPRFLFPIWEKLIRRMTGLGRVNTKNKMWRQDRKQHFCDVLIVGGGPSGLAAAETLSRSELQVLLADENIFLGGTLGYQHPYSESGSAFHKNVLATIQNSKSIKCLTEHFAAGFYYKKTIPLVGPDGIAEVHAKSIIFASGAYEQPIVFRNNDLPGVMLLSAAERLLHRYSVVGFDVGIVLGANSGSYERAINLKLAGANIVAIVDLDIEAISDEKEAAEKHGIEVIYAKKIIEAVGEKNELSHFKLLTKDGVARTMKCDGLLMAAGWTPASNLLVQAGATLDYSDELKQIIPAKMPVGLFAAGQLNGIHELNQKIQDGRGAAAEALMFLNKPSEKISRPERENRAYSHPYPIQTHDKGKEFVDFDEDIQITDLNVAWREGFKSVELMKRYTTIGMGPSQGKVSNMNGVRILAELNKKPVGVIGTTTPRPFTYPVAIGALAGRRLRRYWRSPLHDCHITANGHFEEAGLWLRSMTYGTGDFNQRVEREYATVRHAVGIIDVSTLGKIELFGSDCVKLLEYAYTCSFEKLTKGMTRYIFMTDSSGVLVDDGVAAYLSEGHFYITATSSHAHAVVKQLRLFAAQLDLNVTIIDRTRQVGAINLAGPLSNKVLEKLADQPLDSKTFPYLGVRDMTVNGIQSRVMRVGFVGELGYEIHAPANSLKNLWEALYRAGKEFNIRPFGVEAQRLLRLEKGHLIFGQDTDGMTTPYEVNLGWGVKLSKERFLGRHSLKELKVSVARKMVAFRCQAHDRVEIEECNLIIHENDIAGRITSVSYSPYCKATVGLAMLDADSLPADDIIMIKTTSGEMIPAQVATLPFYDPKNLRQDETTLESSS